MKNDRINILALASRAGSRFDAWGVRLVAILTWIMGVANVMAAVRPTWMSQLAAITDASPSGVQAGSRLASALAGFALFLLAGSLWRRKRTGWFLTILLVTITIIAELFRGPSYGTGLAIGLLIMLILLSRSFYCHSDRPSVRQGLVVLVFAFFFTLVYGAAGFSIEGIASHQQVSFPAAFNQTLTVLASPYNPSLLPIDGFGRYFVASIYVVWIVTLIFALYMTIRPVLVRRPATAEERKRAAEIVEKYGRMGLARAALFDDKSYFFSPGGSVIAYVVRERGVLVLGDPIGPSEDTAEAIETFTEYCNKNDWKPAFMAVLPDNLELYQSAGFVRLRIGKEAIVSLATFCLKGNKNKNIRQTTSKMIRLGYKAEFRQPPLDDLLLRELKKISDAWLSMKVGGELSFTHGWFDDDYIRNGSVFVVYGPDGRPTAFANLIPEYKKNEVTIDMMRRYPETDSGTMDLLYVFMLQWAKENGYESFSLGVSPFVSVGSEPEDPRLEKILNKIARSLNRIYNLNGIHFFKEKFSPTWEPRYLVYPGTASLPYIISTVVRVYSGNNFPWRYLKR